MKKIFYIAFVLLLCSGCISNKQDTAKQQNIIQENAEEFLQDIQNGDFSSLNDLLANNFQDESNILSVPEKVHSYMENKGLIDYSAQESQEYETYYISKLISAYTIKSVEIKGDEALVKAEVKGIDDASARSKEAYEAIDKKMNEYIEENGETDSQAYLISLLENAAARTKQITMNYYIYFEKQGDTWKVSKLQITV